MDTTPLFIALVEGASLYTIGAVRITCISGSANVLGTTLHPGDSHDIVSPPYDSALFVTAIAVQDVRILASSEFRYGGPVLEALQAANGSSGVPATDGSHLHRCVLACQHIPLLSSCLADYDVEGSGLVLASYSRLIRGCVLLPWDPSFPLAHLLSTASATSASVSSFQPTHIIACQGAQGMLSMPLVPAVGPEPASSAAKQRCRVTARGLVQHPAWSPWVERLGENRHAGRQIIPCIVVCGPKGSGKSTFLRYVTNMLLSAQREERRRVAQSEDDDFGPVSGSAAQRTGADQDEQTLAGVVCLDLDVGQPEHGPPGFLSLTHVRYPVLTPPPLRVHAAVPLDAAAGRPGAQPVPVVQSMPILAGTPGAESMAAHTGNDAAAYAASFPFPSPAGVGSMHSRIERAPGRTLGLRFLGATSVKDDVVGFAAAALDLLSQYRSDPALCSRCPLLVNAHGWCTGLGAVSLGRVIQGVRPTHVVHLEAVKGGMSAHAVNGTGGTGGDERDYSEDEEDEGREQEGDEAPGTGPSYGSVPSYRAQDLHITPTSAVVASLGLSFGSSAQGGRASPGLGASAGGQGGQGGYGGPRRAADEDQAALTPPPMAWQHWSPCPSTAAAPSTGGVPSSVVRFAAWHASSLGGAAQVAGVGVKSIPPRAARSPADARALRLLLYLLSNLRYPDGSALVEQHVGEMAAKRSQQQQQTASASNARGGRGEEGDLDSDGDGEAPDASPSAGDDSRMGRSGTEDDAREERESEEDDADGDEEGTSSDLSEEALIELEKDPYAEQPLPSLTFIQAGHLYWHRVRIAGGTMFAGLYNDHRLARTPVRGIYSPAFHARVAVPLRVSPLAIHIALSASEHVPFSHSYPNPNLSPTLGSELGQAHGQAYEDRLHKAEAIVGTLVALASTRLLPQRADGAMPSPVPSPVPSVAQPPSTPTPAPATAHSRPGTTLPCIGLAYVRGYDARAVDTQGNAIAGGLLHLLCPVPHHLLSSVDVLLAWPGSGPEVPVQLMYAAAPEGDPFCFPTHGPAGNSVLLNARDVQGAGSAASLAAVAAGKAVGGGQGRKNLKRRREA